MRRVAVTGLGAMTPLGNDWRSTWDAAVAGRSGIDFISAFDASEYPVRIAAEVKDFDPAAVVGPKEARRLDRYVLLSLSAAVEAWADAGLDGVYEPGRVGVLFGSAIGGIIGIVEQHNTLLERGPDRVSPYFIPSVLPDSASGQIALQFDLLNTPDTHPGHPDVVTLPETEHVGEHRRVRHGPPGYVAAQRDIDQPGQCHGHHHEQREAN